MIENFGERLTSLRKAAGCTQVATPRIAPDPDDDGVIGSALAAKADLVVTGDKPPLTVGEQQGVRVVGVAQAIEAIDASSNT